MSQFIRDKYERRIFCEEARLGATAPTVRSSAGPAPGFTVADERRFASELRILHDMGFTNVEKNMTALNHSKGEIPGAIEMLVAMNTSEPQRNPEDDKLQQLNMMGFTNRERNLDALRRANNNINDAVHFLTAEASVSTAVSPRTSVQRVGSSPLSREPSASAADPSRSTPRASVLAESPFGVRVSPSQSPQGVQFSPSGPSSLGEAFVTDPWASPAPVSQQTPVVEVSNAGARPGRANKADILSLYQQTPNYAGAGYGQPQSYPAQSTYQSHPSQGTTAAPFVQNNRPFMNPQLGAQGSPFSVTQSSFG